MPVEIKELQIKALVASENNRQDNALPKSKNVPKQKREGTRAVTEKGDKNRRQKNDR